MTDLSMEAVRTAAAETIAREAGTCFEDALTAVDRALDAHDRAVKAKGLREAAEAYSAGQISGFFIGPVDYTKHWLRARADQIERAITDALGGDRG